MKVKLPTGILRPLPNAEAANKVLAYTAWRPVKLNIRSPFDIDSEASLPSFGGTELARPGQVGKSQCYRTQSP
jgi:hypothetical protein